MQKEMGIRGQVKNANNGRRYRTKYKEVKGEEMRFVRVEMLSVGSRVALVLPDKVGP
jgi:hypothetical protein